MTQHVFAQLAGQDDNLGDSALRIAYLRALRGPGRHVHVFLGAPTTDYASVFDVGPDVTLYAERGAWAAAERAAVHPVHAFNAGETNPRGGVFPGPRRAAEMARVVAAGGVAIVAGIGLKSVDTISDVSFDPAFRGAAVVSWRDQGSRDAAGFGDFAPDWAYALGRSSDAWLPAASRDLLAVTMRFDRAWPGEGWIAAVRSFAADLGVRVVTLAQVARDAPRAVKLAAALGGEYAMPRSMLHSDLDEHTRSIYGRSVAVVSDRAHGLIIGASEGSYPMGSGSDPQKIARLLSAAGLGGLVGRYDEFGEFAERFPAHLPGLASAVDAARADIEDLTVRIRAVMAGIA